MLVRSLFPASLLKDTIQRARRQVIAGFTRHSHAAWFGGVLELAMAAFRCDENPPIFSQSVQDIADFHRISIA
jgi:hypothetical protein